MKREALLRQLMELKDEDKMVFYMSIYDTEIQKELDIFLKSLNPENLEDYLNTFSPPEVEMIQNDLEKTKKEDDSRVEEAIEKVNRFLENLDTLVQDYKAEENKYLEIQRQNREFLKAKHYTAGFISDQMKGKPVPPLQREIEKDTEITLLPPPKSVEIVKDNIVSCIEDRQSYRKYKGEEITMEELSYLLRSTQGIRKLVANGRISLRTVPSGGARHPFETYLMVNSVKGLTPGIYLYQPVEHQLVFMFDVENRQSKFSEAAFDQKFVGTAPVTFIWSVVPYKNEWRYPITGHKIMLLDAGHVCQNLYLACESIGCGTCAIGAYDQNKFDSLLKLDGKEEFVIYLAPVGKI